MAFDEVKTTYLFLVKFCHPDTGTAGDHLKRTKWMQRANEAKVKNDLPALKILLAEVMNIAPNPPPSATKSSSSQPPPPPPSPTDQQNRKDQERRKEEARRRTEADRVRAKSAADRARAQAASNRAQAQEEADRLAGDVEAKRQRDIIQSQPTIRQRDVQVANVKRSLLKRKRVWGTAIIFSGLMVGGITQLPNEPALTEPNPTSTNAAFFPTTKSNLPMVPAKLDPKSTVPDKPAGATDEGKSLVSLVRVSTPSGMGAYLRNTTSWEDKGQILREGELLEVVRKDLLVDGRRWYYVRVPETGVTGYLPADLVILE